MASSAFEYSSPENHVEKRSAISPALRETMFNIPREEWASNPRMYGEPGHWLQIHKGLLTASATLPAWIEQFTQEEDPVRMQAIAQQISGLGNQLVHHAHGHHHIEDHHFFPVFLRMFPQLEHPLELLDGDHKVLAEVLDDLEKATAAFPVSPEGSDREKRDAWLKGADILMPAAKRLDTLFIRHIGDEEEICIPVMLKA